MLWTQHIGHSAFLVQINGRVYRGPFINYVTLRGGGGGGGGGISQCDDVYIKQHQYGIMCDEGGGEGGGKNFLKDAV